MAAFRRADSRQQTQQYPTLTKRLHPTGGLSESGTRAHIFEFESGGQKAFKAADKATSKLLELYDSDGSEAGSKADLPEFKQSQSAEGPAGPIPLTSAPRRAAPAEGTGDSDESTSDDYGDAEDGGWDEGDHNSDHRPDDQEPVRQATVSQVPANRSTTPLAMVSYKQYAQSKSEEAARAAKAYQILSEYQNLVNKYPKVLEINFCKKLQHSVVHTISTGNNTPCKARPRPLLAGTKKAVESKKTWFKLEELGVVRRVRADEPTTWSSPLHLALKSDGTYRPCRD